jgi:hypothetical protein
MFSNSFLEPLYPSYKLVKKLSKIGKIDNSHNHHHSKEVLFWSKKIIERLPFKFPQKDILMIGQCAILHDLIDSKYTNFSKEVEEHLNLYHNEFDVYFMMKIMKTMSYSKIVTPEKINYPTWIVYSKYFSAYHVVREADLLASYNIARMIEYRQNIGNYTDEEIRTETIKLYNNRMATLIKRHLFFYDTTVYLAQSLNEIATLKLELLPYINLNENLDILRIVNNLSIHDLIYKFEQLPSK